MGGAARPAECASPSTISVPASPPCPTCCGCPSISLKIDRGFVSALRGRSGLPGGPGRQKIVGGVVRLAHGLRRAGGGRGVETEEEFAAVERLGCEPEVQGHLCLAGRWLPGWPAALPAATGTAVPAAALPCARPGRKPPGAPGPAMLRRRTLDSAGAAPYPPPAFRGCPREPQWTRATASRSACGPPGKGTAWPVADPGKGGIPSAAGVGFRAGVEVVSALIVGVGIGWLLDRWLGTSPWFFLVFFLIGGAARGAERLSPVHPRRCPAAPGDAGAKAATEEGSRTGGGRRQDD